MSTKIASLQQQFLDEIRTLGYRTRSPGPSDDRGSVVVVAEQHHGMIVNIRVIEAQQTPERAAATTAQFQTGSNGSGEAQLGGEGEVPPSVGEPPLRYRELSPAARKFVARNEAAIREYLEISDQLAYYQSRDEHRARMEQLRQRVLNDPALVAVLRDPELAPVFAGADFVDALRSQMEKP